MILIANHYFIIIEKNRINKIAVCNSHHAPQLQLLQELLLPPAPHRRCLVASITTLTVQPALMLLLFARACIPCYTRQK
jgi:hypothetical protein